MLPCALLLFCFGSIALARFKPRGIDATDSTVYLADLVDRDVLHASQEISQDAAGVVPLFAYESLHLTTAEVDAIQTVLRKQYGATKLNQYWSLCDFAASNVTGTASTSVNYNLAGARDCKIFPGDAAWPSQQDWTVLNLATGGALLKPVPQAHVCYANGTGDIVDATACKTLTDNWTGQYFQNGLNDPIEMLSPLYEGMTCQPPTIFNRSGTCTQGGYPVYVVNVTNVAQIQLAVNYARNTGVRLVIKNTGHDFSGKSGGAGSLSIWTHHLKQTAFIPSYIDSTYSGPAIKAGVGVQGFELYKFANQHGVIALGGECPTVGAMGGWIQGGGHSPVSSLWGMGADHALGFEVVTADGHFVTANKDSNPDLFWALRGGGGSTFGVVTSVIVRVHEDIPVTSASWSFATGPNVSTAAFSAGLKAYYKTFPSGADNEIYAYFNIFNIAGTMTFTMAPFFAPNKSLAEAQAVIQPWLDQMASLHIPVKPKWQTFDGFYDAYNASFPVEGVNNEGVVTASRMFPRANWANDTIFNATFDAFWDDLEAGMAVIGYNIAPTWIRGGRQDTPVNPAWREAIAYQITGIVQNLTQPASHLVEQRLNFTNGPMQRWRDLTPGSGAYLNEADRLEPNFQWAFWGSYYPRLLELKKRYDPFNLFYAWTAVGSEFFTIKSVDGYPDENGRLCVNDKPSLYYPEGPVYVPQ